MLQGFLLKCFCFSANLAESSLRKSSTNRGLMANQLFTEGYKQPVGLLNTFH